MQVWVYGFDLCNFWLKSILEGISIHKLGSKTELPNLTFQMSDANKQHAEVVWRENQRRTSRQRKGRRPRQGSKHATGVIKSDCLA